MLFERRSVLKMGAKDKMRITKQRLRTIIKEEVNSFASSRKINEVASYVQDIFASMREKYGDTKLLEMMVDYMGDSEAMDVFYYISKQQGQSNVPLEPQQTLGTPSDREQDQLDTGGEDDGTDFSSEPTADVEPNKTNKIRKP